MAYMKKNVNFGFFLLLVACLICFAGLSIYYQATFKDLYMDYKHISSTLSTKKAKLEQTSQELTIKEEREKELSTQYTGLKTEKEKLQDEKVSLQKQLTTKTNELIQKKAELFTANKNLATAQAELVISKTSLEAATTTILGLRSDINSLEDERDSLAVQLAACQST